MNLTQLDLDLDVFQGPFDLLLALVMREEIELAEVPIAEIVVAYVERAYDDGELDLESASEFLVLIAALLEIKVRMLFPGEEDEESDGMTAEQAEAELLARLIEYKRYAAAAAWLAAAGASERRVFRAGPAPLAPRPEPVVEAFSEDPWQLQAAVGRLLQAPPEIDLSAVRRRLVPVSEFLTRFRAVLRERRAFGFDEAVAGLDRLSHAAAFLAILEMWKQGEVQAEQGEVFGTDPHRPARPGARRVRRAGHRVSELTHTVEALLFVASEPLSVRRDRDAGRGAAGPGRAGARRPARPLLRGAFGRGARARRRRVRVPRLARDGRGLRPPRQPAELAGAQPGRPRDAGRSSPTWGRSRGPRSPASAASLPTRPSPGCSSAA